MVDLSKVYINPNNPRFIKDHRFEKLCDNIRQYPKFLEFRPIVVESRNNLMILGGNMRYRALLHIGYTEIDPAWIKYADELSETEKQAFIIIDNLDFGEWDYEALANEWSKEQLLDWGVDLPVKFEEKPEEKAKKELSEAKKTYKLEIIFSDQNEQKRVYSYLIDKGYRCKTINS